MRPTSAVLRSQSRLAELPPDTTASDTPRSASSDPASADSSAMFRSSGTTPLRQARLAPMPASARPGSEPTWRATAGRSSGSTPSRRSPSSTMTTTPCTTPAARAAPARAVSTSGSVLQLVVAAATTRSTWLGRGERTSTIGASTPPARRRSTLSMRASPSPATPAATRTRATAGWPSTALVTAVTPMPRSAAMATSTAALAPMASRSTSTRGALTRRRSARRRRGRGRRPAPCRPGGRPGATGHR